MKLYVLAATAALVALLSDATGARGQGVGWESSIREVQSTYQTLAERGVRPALIYDAEGFADMAGGARRGASIQPDVEYVFNPNTDPRVPNALVGLIRIELAF